VLCELLSIEKGQGPTSGSL